MEKGKAVTETTETPRVSAAQLEAIQNTLARAKREHGNGSVERICHAMAIAAGLEAPVHAESPHQRPEFIFPGLTASAWHDAARFPFVSTLEARWPDILEELHQRLSAKDGFQPYRQDRDYFVPHGFWKALFFRVGNSWIEENRPLCPRTFQTLETVPRLAEIAMFSALNPGGHIKPHCGTWNCRITVHLGLIIPPVCEMRVGSEIRPWTAGKCSIFDDSFEHEVWNRSGQTRFILLLDVWHPDLTDLEVSLLEYFRDVLKLHDGSEMVSSIRQSRHELTGKSWWA